MASSPQDKESGLQDNAGLIFRWFVHRGVGEMLRESPTPLLLADRLFGG
jgi:hypothetical protein